MLDKWLDKYEFVIYLSLVFGIFYGIAESYIWFLNGLYSGFTGIFLSISKIFILTSFSFLFLYIFSLIFKIHRIKDLKLHIMVISGFLAIFIKDFINLFTHGLGEGSTFLRFISIPIQDILFGTAFIFASYLIVEKIIYKEV